MIVFGLAWLALGLLSLNAQSKYFTRTGTINFDAEGPLKDVEEVKAQNNSATCVLDAATGKMEWAVLMKGFHFRNALMEEHFNENYVESTKFPKAVFAGAIGDMSAVSLGKDGTYPVKVSGKMTLHGVTKEVAAPGTITVQGGKISAQSSFQLLLSDYGIKIPSLVGNKVSNQVSVQVRADLEELKK